MSILKKITLLLVLMFSMITTSAFSGDLEKLDPVLLAAKHEAESSGVDLGEVTVQAIVLLDSEHFYFGGEEQVRRFFSDYGLHAQSVIFGQGIIVTVHGSLAAVIEVTGEDAIKYIEGSRVLFPEPGVSVGN